METKNGVYNSIQNDSNTCKCCLKMFVVQDNGRWFCAYCETKRKDWHCPKCYEKKVDIKDNVPKTLTTLTTPKTPKTLTTPTTPNVSEEIIKSMVSITISISNSEEKNKKVPDPTYWIKAENLICLHCKEPEGECRFKDTYCYDCGHCSCEKVCLKCNFHSYSCNPTCSEPDMYEARFKAGEYTGGHFIHKNEKGEYVHNILCGCDDFDTKTSEPFNFVPISDVDPEELKMEELGYEWETNSGSTSSKKQTRIEDFFPKRVIEENSDYVLDSWMDYESGSLKEDFRSIDDYNVNSVNEVALNNYVLDNLDNFDIEAFLAEKASENVSERAPEA